VSCRFPRPRGQGLVTVPFSPPPFSPPDGDCQLSLNWGADIVGGQARLQTCDGTGVFPGASSAGSDRALADLPPPPMDAPEPAALALLAGPLIALLPLRRQRCPHRGYFAA